ncbi:MAG TPA: asparagine synthase (glutamine-hydrolyzing) [Phycisphaerales bacterium]|nr:asparagine synthase (glutamine-hydrolyzing) [Phycisphaerales bacterium]
MCGITGIISKAAINDDQTQRVARLNDLLTHRGPDGEGTLRLDHACLAMRRLSVIDLSTGWQPLYNEDRSLALICNGEVYNFVELRRALEARGHRFATKSDCETILHLYEDHGEECVHHLRGMYAFALWDARRRRVLIVRDRVGEKPLYLVERGGEITFCSELHPLVQAGVIGVELDPGAIHQYFHFGYVPEPRCPLKGVRKLPAGHLLSIDVDSWNMRERCYWRMEDAPPIEGDPAKRIREELDRISELVIRSDVPVGVALSGGLDSSLIATLAHRKYPGTMHAISIGYEGRPVQDERSMARELADYLRMPMHEVEITRDDMVQALPKVVVERDDPICDSSGIGYWTVMRKAREQGIPVMLAGQGGDELFWGYGWVRNAARATLRKRSLLHSNGSGASVGVRDYLSLSRPPYSYTAGIRWLRSLAGLRTGLKQYREDRAGHANRMVFHELEPVFREAMNSSAGMYSGAFSEEALRTDVLAPFDHAQPWPNIEVAITKFIAETYLQENGIAQGDRLSMAWSVELRLPLVDYRLFEIVIGLTKQYGHLNLPPKHWLREAVRGEVPDFVFNRRKRGFTPPWRQWGRAMADAYGDQLLDGELVHRGVLTPKAARHLRKWLSPPALALPRHMADRALVLEMWCRGLTTDGASRTAARRPAEVA